MSAKLAQQREASQHAQDPYKPSPRPAKASNALPRVAMLGSKSPAAKSEAKREPDRFATVGSIYYSNTETPNALAYADAAKPSARGGPTGLSFGSGHANRFAGHDSRYRKGLRQSTMPIHDPKVYEAKQVDDAVPLPKVRVEAEGRVHANNTYLAGRML